MNLNPDKCCKIICNIIYCTVGEFNISRSQIKYFWYTKFQYVDLLYIQRTITCSGTLLELKFMLAQTQKNDKILTLASINFSSVKGYIVRYVCVLCVQCMLYAILHYMLLVQIQIMMTTHKVNPLILITVKLSQSTPSKSTSPQTCCVARYISSNCHREIIQLHSTTAAVQLCVMYTL